MATFGFAHEGHPGFTNGLGADIRGTMAADSDFTTDWTVHPLVTFDAATTSERSYWVVEHVNGHQIIFGVGHGSLAGGDQLFWSRHTGFSGVTDRTIWCALDPNGGGVASNSFYDNLNNNALDPINSGFWNQAEYSQAVRLVEWFNTGTQDPYEFKLWFVHSDTDGRLIIASNGREPSRDQSISWAILTDNLVDMTGRPVDDQVLPKLHGVVAVQADTDGGGNDVVEWVQYVFPDAAAVKYQKQSNDTNINLDWWIGDQLGNGKEPDAAGDYITQSIGVTLQIDTTNGIEERFVGIMNTDLIRYRGYNNAPNGKRLGDGTLMAACAETVIGWHPPLGDILF